MSIKKKYTKRNTIMAFVTIEDLYGACEVVVFDNCYQNSLECLIEDNIVIVEGKLSIREDEENVTIVARTIKPFTITEKNKNKSLVLNIVDLEEDKKERLRGIIKFFSGETANISLKINTKNGIQPCGAIYITDKIFSEFEEILGKDRIKIE